MATLGQYIAWLKSTGGTSKTGMGADPDIGMVPVTKLIAESGRHVIYPGADGEEELSPYMVDYLDRRLGVMSPFKGSTRS